MNYWEKILLFVIISTLWVIYESISIIVISLPSSRASDEEITALGKEVAQPRLILIFSIIFIVMNNALLLISLGTISGLASEQTIRHYIITALLISILSDIILCSEGMVRTLTGENKPNLMLTIIRRVLKVIVIILVCIAIVMGL
jgi:hypothetical protein